MKEIRGMLEDDFTQRKCDIVSSTKSSNQQLVRPFRKGLDLFGRLEPGKEKQRGGRQKEATRGGASRDQTA
jgi:hypothetical protein